MAGKTIGELYVALKADTSKFEASMNATLKRTQGFVAENQKAFNKIGRSLSIASAVMVAAGVKIVKSYVQTGSEIHDMSVMTGMSTEYISRLSKAAKLADMDLGSIRVGMRKFNQTLDDAITKGGEARNTFARLFKGDWKKLLQMTPDERFDVTIKALSEITDETKRTALAQQLFGRSGMEMLKMLDGGYAGFVESQKGAVEWTREQAAAANELGDRFDELKIQMFELQKTLLESGFLDRLTEVLKKIDEIIVKTQDWIDKNPELAKSLTENVIIIGGIIAGLTTLGLVLTTLTPLFNAWGGVLALTVTAGTLWIKNWEDIKEGWKIIVEGIYNAFVWLVNKLNELTDELIKTSLPFLKIYEMVTGKQIKIFSKYQFGYKEALSPQGVQGLSPEALQRITPEFMNRLSSQGKSGITPDFLESIGVDKAAAATTGSTTTVYVNNPISPADEEKLIRAVETRGRQIKFVRNGLGQ